MDSLRFASFMKTEMMLNHPTFLHDLSWSLMLDDDYLVLQGEITPESMRETWEKALRRRTSPLMKLRLWLRRLAAGFPRMKNRQDGEAVKQYLAEAVLELREPFQSTLLRHFYHTVPLSEVAEFYAEPLGKIKVRLRKSLSRLCSRLDAKYGYRRLEWCAALTSIAFASQSND